MKTLITGGSFTKFFKNIFSFNRTRQGVEMQCKYAAESTSSLDHKEGLKSIKQFIPKLTVDLHKGSCGRVGVIGGSFEYTGAPYFAAISSLKVGVDLVHVFCCRDAGPVIKSYSPELIVHPFLDSEDVVRKIEPWLARLHALVIGPGMGRDADLLKNVGNIITHCKTNMNMPPALIIDADGLYLITEDVDLIRDYPGPLILTPNAVEYTRLSGKLGETDALKLATALNAVIVQKGEEDIITNGIQAELFKVHPNDLALKCDVPGSNRRCGGQGDVLSGCMAAFVAWLQIHFLLSSEYDFISNQITDKKGNMICFEDTYMLYSWAAYGACVLTRTCSRLAYEGCGRGMTASDMITHINRAFRIHFGI